MKKKEITLRTVLEECLEWKRDIKRLCSKNYDGRLPMDGMEDEFYAQEESCRILRELLQAIKSEKVIKAIYEWDQEQLKDWQKIALDGPEMKLDVSPAEEPMRL